MGVPQPRRNDELGTSRHCSQRAHDADEQAREREWYRGNFFCKLNRRYQRRRIMRIAGRPIEANAERRAKGLKRSDRGVAQTSRRRAKCRIEARDEAAGAKVDGVWVWRLIASLSLSLSTSPAWEEDPSNSVSDVWIGKSGDGTEIARIE
jgi:hypothetical protein